CLLPADPDMFNVVASTFLVRLVSGAATPVLGAPEKSIVVPVDEGFTSVMVDGQEVELLVDSGTWDLIVIDGHWYEEKFGEGACDKPHSGCFFCPVEAPCDFDKEQTVTTTFADDVVIERIFRTGRLVLAGNEVTRFVYSIARLKGSATKFDPQGYFGLALQPPESEKIELRFHQESFLESLLRHNLIGRLSYTTRSNGNQDSPFLSGQVTLGDRIDESDLSNYMFPQWVDDEIYRRAFATVPVLSVEVFHARRGHRKSPYPQYSGLGGSRLEKRRREGGRARGSRPPKSFLELPGHRNQSVFQTRMDTGCNGIYLPYPQLLEEIEKKLKGALRREGYTEELIWMWNDYGVAYVKEEARPFLPWLKVSLGDEGNSIPISILPEHYCLRTGLGYDAILVGHNAHATLGTPFFRALSVHVDYNRSRIGLLRI
ncbi:hypothetical protein FOZ62_029128, partial [Perkinsus olseni]